jgi:signal peptidase I
VIESDLPPSADTPPAPEEPARSRSSAKSILEWLGVILGALLVALLIKTFLLQAFYIPSRSMEPTLRIGDRVLVNKLSYKMHDINRGDIVVFERPPDEPPDAIKDLIKRVIALPGETISSENGQVFIDGRPLEEPYLEPGTVTENLPPTLVPEGHVFVMGDNRGDSRDSRYFGPIEEDLVVGRAFVRIWPVTHLGFL